MRTYFNCQQWQVHQTTRVLCSFNITLVLSNTFTPRRRSRTAFTNTSCEKWGQGPFIIVHKLKHVLCMYFPENWRGRPCIQVNTVHLFQNHYRDTNHCVKQDIGFHCTHSFQFVTTGCKSVSCSPTPTRLSSDYFHWTFLINSPKGQEIHTSYVLFLNKFITMDIKEKIQWRK
jgi:hypothetical protein